MKEGPPPHRLRRLSDEEIALWTEVARSVSRRRGASLPAPAKPLPAKAQARLRPRRAASRSQARQAAPAAARADRAAAEARTRPRARRDRRRARPARHEPGRGASGAARLPAPLPGARGAARDRRHRQGRPARRAGPWGEERGVLRRLVPHWLREPDLRSVVLGFEEAGRAHGGSGALYVRLRRAP